MMLPVLHMGEYDSADVRGTLWAAYNGVTELADHYLPVGRDGSWLASV